MEKPLYPFLSLWIHPRETIRRLIDSQPNKTIVLLAIIYGLISGYRLPFSLQDYLAHIPTYIVIPMCLAIGVIVSLIYLYFYSWVYQFCGRWIGGKGSYTDVKCAVGWIFYPQIIVSILWSLPVYPLPLWLITLTGFLAIAVSIWSLIITFKLIAEAHRFPSSWKGVATVVIALLLTTGAMMLIGLIVAFFQ